MSHISPLSKLIDSFRGLPGIGQKLAVKLAYYIVECDSAQVERFIAAISEAKANIRLCPICCNFTDKNVCKYCDNEYRDKSVICVVEQPRDVMSFERTKEYRGMYHVLHGALSPLSGVTPSDIRLQELLARLKDDSVKEIIMATNPNVEGEATAMYVSRLLKPIGFKVTRIAHGLPVGADIEFADEVTLAKALENRRDMN
ncbi:MAG: recombination mediator RecR [Negativicutes bacterium]|jgi:recombination protein RecR